MDVKALPNSHNSHPRLPQCVSSNKNDLEKLMKHSHPLFLRERREVTFKFLSLKTLLHCIWYFAPTATIVLLYNTQIMQDARKISQEVLAAKNLVDRLSQFTIFVFGALFTLYPFLIASGLPKISELALANDLKFPKFGKRILLSMLLHLATQIISES